MYRFLTFILTGWVCLHFAWPVFGQLNFESSNLPVIVINTNGRQILNEPKIPASMGIIDNGPDNRNYLSDVFNDYNGNIGIELRGSSSQFIFDKKSFGIETWDENLADTSVSLLGIPAEEDWVLYGPYSDKTLLRNVLAFKLGRDLGRYASQTRLCELVLNGQYWGVYVLMEKVKRDKNRVDISKLNPDENSGDDLTGGYIVKLDKFDGGNSGNGWTSKYRPPNYANQEQVIFFQYDYPKNDEITAQQQSYIKQFMNAFEEALRTKPLGDLINGYRSYVDISSFIDYAIINEVTRNVDAYRLSTFLYKDKNSVDGRLYMGPIWDYNLAFGNADYCDGSRTEGWAWNFNYVCNQDYWLIPFWWYRFQSDQYFTSQLAERWRTLRSGPYQTEKILDYIDSMALVLTEARERNFERWNIMGTYIWPNEFVGSNYQQELTYLKDWITARMLWIDNNIESLITSVEPELVENAISVYPNPFHDRLMIDLSKTQRSLSKIEIYNLAGELVFSVNEEQISGSDRFLSWDGRNELGIKLPQGLYLLSLKMKGKPPVIKKLLKH